MQRSEVCLRPQTIDLQGHYSGCVRPSLSTMTKNIRLRRLTDTVCPAVADQSDVDCENSAARRAQVVRWVDWQRVGYEFVQLTLLLSLCNPALLVRSSAFADTTVPDGEVLR
ncbi:hypothetical protein NDU88_003810 [Pleurodeles waltl]|uniref:Uncharacterized protein n=1 Tax=Pleurodeles waltl TaxID=8319 RepID=A0AAV7T7Q2_PLEWA|nr:hypothetical protein NDU88_003810 [Pleurodeles waltl]